MNPDGVPQVLQPDRFVLAGLLVLIVGGGQHSVRGHRW
jgi:hypothetical protein